MTDYPSKLDFFLWGGQNVAYLWTFGTSISVVQN